MSLKTPTGPLDIPVETSAPAPAAPTPEVSEGSLPSKGLLINRNFALLAVGQAISNIGDFVYAPTLLVWVFVLTHSAGAVSGVWIAEYAPVFLLGPVAGVFVDRWNRRTTMIVADVLRAIVALFPLFAPDSLRLPTIYTSVFLISGLARFFMPAKSGVLQVIVSEKQQPQAASISQATFALSFIVGPAIASPLYFVVGPTVALVINAATFVVSALSLVAMRVSKEALHPYSVGASLVGAQEHSGGGLRAVLRELAAGYLFVVKTRVLLMVVFLGLIAMLGAGALNALDIIFVNQNLHVSASLYGPLMAAGGAGTLLGAIVAGLVVKKLSPKDLLVGGVFFTGAGIMVYSFLTWYPLALVVNFLIGIPQAAINVGFGPLLLGVTPQTMMGRVQSVIETAMFGISLVSIGLAGYFGQFVPVSIIFLVSGVLIVLSGIFGWFSLPATASPETAKQE